MRLLSAIDASFLYAETARTPMHVAALQIYDPSTAASDITLQTIAAQITSRAHLIDCFHNKLVTTPWHLDHPHWVDDPNFDALKHVREETLSAPGDWRTLLARVAHLVTEPLPRDRPLWRMRLIHGLHQIDGLPEGAFAILTELHHAAVDGVAGIGVTAAFHDLQPESSVVNPPERASAEPDVQPASLAMTGLLKELFRPLRTYAALPALNRLANSLRASPVPSPAPSTRLNRRLSANRVFDAIQMPLAVLQQCRRLVSGATVNDVLLALIGGALRRYLSHHSELPHRSLTALVPMSTHADAQQINTGNQVSQMVIPLGSDTEDVTTRLRNVHASTTRAKTAAKQLDADSIDTVSALAPAALVEFAATNMRRSSTVPFNTVVTNVKGPPVPFYLCGAELIRAYGMGPLVDRMGFFHTILSYRGEVSLSVLACARLMPDVDFYMTCLSEELTALTDAAQGSN